MADLGIELVKLVLIREVEAVEQVVAGSRASFIHEGEAEVVPRASHLEDGAAVAGIGGFIRNCRYDIRTKDRLPQIHAAQRHTTGQKQAAVSVGVELGQFSVGGFFVGCPLRNGSCASAVVDRGDTRHQDDAHQVVVGDRVLVVRLSGDDARFDDGPVDRLERAGFGVATLQALQLDPLSRSAAGAVVARDEGVFAGIWIDVKDVRSAKGIVDYCARTNLS